MSKYTVVEFTEEKSDIWDKFVIENSINGTFLQTRNFLNYHPKERFVDNSLLIYKGTDTLVAVIPACIEKILEGNVFYSHKGSTFGGIIIGSKFNKINDIIGILDSFQEYVNNKRFVKVILKNLSRLFSRDNIELLEYVLFNKGYKSYDELSLYIDYKKYKNDIILNFNSKTRNIHRKAEKNNFIFKELKYEDEIKEFYLVLEDNLKKFNIKPIHTLNELIDFRFKRLKDIVTFYGLYYEDKMVAGTMLFKFNEDIIHTQYLAAIQEYLYLNPMNYLYYSIIKEARELGYNYLSWGISTENCGKILNNNLANFKESFGSSYSINRTYYKAL